MLHWWKGIDWIRLAENRNKGEHDNETLGSIKVGEFND
jgi:hypothetical protein